LPRGGRRGRRTPQGCTAADFLKRNRFEISGIGGFYASDTAVLPYSYGGALSFYPSEDFGIEALVTRSPVKFRWKNRSAGSIGRGGFCPGCLQGIMSLILVPDSRQAALLRREYRAPDIFVVAPAPARPSTTACRG